MKDKTINDLGAPTPPTSPVNGNTKTMLSADSGVHKDVDETKKRKKCVCVCHDETDDGVPFFCKDKSSIYCPLHPLNPLLSANKYCLMFGNVGFPHFDRNRRHYQGFALGWTILAFFFTMFGALGTLNEENLLRISFWSWGRTYKQLIKTSSTDDYSEIFIGLRGFLARSCVFTNFTSPHTDTSGGLPFNCSTEIYPWVDERAFTFDETDTDVAEELAYQKDMFGRCNVACLGTWGGAVLSCFTMIFAMIGASNRMRFFADSPQQKLLGCIPDTIGSVTLALSLIEMERTCLGPLRAEHGHNFVDPNTGEMFETITWLRGGGFWTYWGFCFSGCLFRALIHWLTPLPGMGVGAFTFTMPLHMAQSGGHRLRDALEKVSNEAWIVGKNGLDGAVALSKMTHQMNRRMTRTGLDLGMKTIVIASKVPEEMITFKDRVSLDRGYSERQSDASTDLAEFHAKNLSQVTL
jgi:hypothetical protein